MGERIVSVKFHEQLVFEPAEKIFASIKQPEKKWYVYMLFDPDTELPFYVGKGTGDRIDQHEQDLDNDFLGNPAKKWIIRNILARDKQVLKRKVAEFDSEQEAYIYESKLITLFGSFLTNIMPGSDGLREKAEKPKKKWQDIQNSVPLEQEIITFQGKPLAIVCLPSGNMYAVLRWICEKLHVDTKGQIQRIKRHEIISNHLFYARVQTDGGPQVMPILALGSVPYWLATIDTSRMSRGDERRQEITEYQRGAADALYEAFTFPYQE